MDDRFNSDSTVYKKPDEFPSWKESFTVLEYFQKAFSLGQQNHRCVQNMRKFFPRTYEEAERLAFKTMPL